MKTTKVLADGKVYTVDVRWVLGLDGKRHPALRHPQYPALPLADPIP